MANITLSVPKELKEKMEKFPEINWSEVSRQAIRQKTMQLSIIESINLGELTERDVIELKKKLKKL